MIGIILTKGQQETLEQVLQWMVGDSEYATDAARIDVVPVGATRADRETWNAVALAAQIWGAKKPHPLDEIGLIRVIERRLRDVPVIREPELEPEPELKQGSLF
jgi:hypothetical protein